MNEVLKNTCNLSLDLYINYFKKHVFKNLRKITLICDIILLINLTFLFILNAKGLNNIGAIILTVSGLILASLLYFFIPSYLGSFNYHKIKNINEKYLINKFIFMKNKFEVKADDVSTIEYYNNIRRIVKYDEFSVIEMKNKKINYIIQNNKFENGNILDLERLIKEDV